MPSPLREAHLSLQFGRRVVHNVALVQRPGELTDSGDFALDWHERRGYRSRASQRGRAASTLRARRSVLESRARARTGIRSGAQSASSRLHSRADTVPGVAICGRTEAPEFGVLRPDGRRCVVSIPRRSAPSYKLDEDALSWSAPSAKRDACTNAPTRVLPAMCMLPTLARRREFAA